MRALLLVSVAGVALAQGCGCSSNVAASQAGSVKLALLDQGTFTRHGLVQEYQVTNNGNAAVYFVRPESSFGNADAFYAPPFYELHEGDALNVYSYIAPEPGATDRPAYPYVLRRLGPGETFRGKIELAGPLRFNPPYPPPALDFQRYPIDGFWIRRLQLTVGVLPCPDLDLKVDAEGNARGIGRRLRGIACGTTRGRPAELQRLVTAERTVQFTGCWENDPGRPASVTCDQEEAREH